MKYIDPVGKILSHVDRLAAWQSGTKTAPVNIEWDLSNRCSLGCADCHFAYTHTRGPLKGRDGKPVNHTAGGDLAEIQMVKRALHQAKEAGVLSVTWTGGGEPTLHPDFDEMVEYADFLGLRQGLYTNACHIDYVRGERLAKLLDWAVVSVDCYNSADYSAYKGVSPKFFEQMKSGATNLLGGQCVVGASFLLGAENWTTAWKMLAFAREIGFDYTTFRPLVQYDLARPSQLVGDVSWVTAALPLLNDLSQETDVECLPQRFMEYRDWAARDYPVCYGVRFNTVVTPNGKVWVCVNRREFEGSELGDLSTESFADIWARHPGEWKDFEQCRVLCRLHLINRTVWNVYRPRPHAEFI